MSRPTWAEINLAAVAHNTRQVVKQVGPDVQVMAVVKADAYGHGAEAVARVVLAHGAQWLGVALLEEALMLRSAGIKAPILVLGDTPSAQLAELVAAEVTQTVFTLDKARELDRVAAGSGRKARVHVKVDTGMGRLGLLPEQALVQVEQMARLAHLKLEGLFTHFATADEQDKGPALRQLETFLELVFQLERRGIIFALKHAANSAGVIDLPQAHLDLVRPGIMLYGLYPSPEVQRRQVQLLPAMTFKTRVAQIKTLQPGSGISYGHTYVASGPVRIAALPVGYADGFPRCLSNCGEVALLGQRAPVVGRVCMDWSMIDITRIPEVEVGTEVVLFGEEGANFLPVDEVAERAGSISYELLCAVSQRVPRVYT